MTTYKTTIVGDTYQMRANFAEASCPIQIANEYGWLTTPYQVAYFLHRPGLAMRQLLEEYVRDGGDNPDEFASQIADAVDAMDVVAVQHADD